MGKQYILAIDRGQSKIKAALYNSEAEVAFVNSEECQEIQARQPGWAEQDMELMWQQTICAIKGVLNKSGVNPKEIIAVSFSGQGGGNFMIDKEGKPAYPGVLSLDSRHEKVFCPNNLPRTLAFMYWLKKNEPEVYSKVRWIFGCKDYLRYCLTGKVNVDISDTPAPVNLEEKKYVIEGLDEAGISEVKEMLPEILYASEICGSVTEQAAQETGLLEGTPVVVGAHDMIACSLGAGGYRPGHLTIIMGTLGINIAVVNEKIKLKESVSLGKFFMFGGAFKGVKTVTTSIGSACNTVNWVLDTMFIEEKKEAESLGISVFTLIERKLRGMEPTNVIFQPYLMGTFYNSAAKLGWTGIHMGTTREELLLSVFQGVCISMCIEIERLEKKVGRLDDVWLVGGGSESSIWRQMFADALGRPIHICKTNEVGCRGAAVCAEIALKGFAEDAHFWIPKEGGIYYPNPRRTAIYKEQIQIYKKVYDMAVSVWEQQKSYK